LDLHVQPDLLMAGFVPAQCLHTTLYVYHHQIKFMVGMEKYKQKNKMKSWS